MYRHSLWIAFVTSVGALGFAFVAQYAFNLQPCVLCVYQRWPYAVIIGIAFAGIMLARKFGTGLFQLFAAVGFAVTSSIGAFHVGVEFGWWEGTSECVADTSATQSLEQLRAQIMSAPLAKCNEVAWELFGISMAGYNMLIAGMLCLFMILAFLKTRSSNQTV